MKRSFESGKKLFESGKKYCENGKERYKEFVKASPMGQVIVEASVTFLGVHLFLNNVYGFTLCVGPSMIPTIDPAGELALIERLPYKFGKEYKVGDVVISGSMDDINKTVCKRIQGVSGEVVHYYDKKNHRIAHLKIPDGSVWLLGDNPSNSNDSRSYGPVPLKLLQGRVIGKMGMHPFHITHIDDISYKHNSKDDD